jgi:hypothetical protein
MVSIITCFRKLSRTPYFTTEKERWNIDMFRPFVDAGLNCIIVVDSDQETPEWMNAAQIIRVSDHENKKTSDDVLVPKTGNPDKDTPEYIAWTYDKPRLYLAGIAASDSTHYLCLDYDAATWLGGDSIGYLKWICAHSPASRGICIPGGWDKYTDETVKTVASKICWRFCNGCIFADRYTLKEWCHLHQGLIAGFKMVYCDDVLPWDVNFVAWIEYKQLGPKVTWYAASHDRSMVENIPFEFFISPISVREKVQCEYPEWPKHYPSSASVCKINDTWWMITRYVNYWMYPNGCYSFYESDHKIRTRNLLSRLSPETWTPVESWFIDDEVIGCDGLPLATYDTKMSFGVEDVRIYPGEEGELRFVGATLGFSPEGNARIVSGVVDISGLIFTDAKIHSSGEWCEKNWIPVLDTESDVESESKGQQFIYKWAREGIIVKSGDAQRVVPVSPEHSGIIHRFRGSSILMPYQDGYKCLVHWSKEGSPRTYYHATVLLTRDLAIREISPGFMFEGPGVEFCIGYVPGETEDRFWVSRFDRDPYMAVVAR